MAYIDQHKRRFGVEPICAALRAQGIAVAPSGYYAHKKRGPSRRALHDAALAETIEATFFDRDKGRGLYGVRKMWHQLRRDRVTGQGGGLVARCTVERLMRELGLRGGRRGAPTITTRPDQQAGRAPDLVDRLSLNTQSDKEDSDLSIRCLSGHDRVHHGDHVLALQVLPFDQFCNSFLNGHRLDLLLIQKVLQQGLPLPGQNRLRMKLYALNAVLAMPQPHDQTISGLG